MLKSRVWGLGVPNRKLLIQVLTLKMVLEMNFEIKYN